MPSNIHHITSYTKEAGKGYMVKPAAWPRVAGGRGSGAGGGGGWGSAARKWQCVSSCCSSICQWGTKMDFAFLLKGLHCNFPRQLSACRRIRNWQEEFCRELGENRHPSRHNGRKLFLT